MNKSHFVSVATQEEKITSAGISWPRFLTQALKDLRLYAYGMICLSLFRFILIMTFISRKDPVSGAPDILSVMANGLRFDSRDSVFLILPTFILSAVGAFFPLDKFIDRTRYVIAMIFTALTLFVCSATIPFFREYNDQFNQWILGLFFDDFEAIMKTIWAQVPVVSLLFLMIALTAAAAFLLKRIFNYKSRLAISAQQWSLRKKIVWTLCMLLILVAAGRGSIGRRPVQIKDVAVTRDGFLNKTVLNPYDALRYLFSDYRQLRSVKGIQNYLPDGDIRSAVKSYFNDPRDFNNIDQYMERICPGAGERPPKHIFLIVMESYDSWPMLDKYQSMQLCTQLKSIAGKGIWIRRFLSMYVGTTPALTSIITGLPDPNVRTNYQPSAAKPYPSAIAPIFKSLGYKTRFFYGGYLSWQRIGDFCRNQGFDEVYGAPDMGTWAHSNEWGVDDEALYEFIEKTISDDQPSFSMVMTTSYHPPYDIDVYGMGFPIKTIPSDLAGIYNREIDLKVYGHLWYADKVLGDFIHKMEKKLDRPLFAMTGDHYGRKFLNDRPTLYEKSSVPFVLYGPAVLSGRQAPDDVVGCHTDIGPTVIELSAPQGFVYHGIGRNLLAKHSPQVAFGAQNIIIGPEFIMQMDDPKKIEPLPGFSFSRPDAGEMIRLANEYYAIGWWRVMRGSALP